MPRNSRIGEVYLVCLDRPIGDLDNPHGHASHYIGWAVDHLDRDKVHRTGNGCAMLRWCVANGVDFHVTRVWENVTRDFERKLKRFKNAKKLCPDCSGSGALRRMTA